MEKFYFVQYHDKEKLDEIIKLDEDTKGLNTMRRLGLFSMSCSYASEEELIKEEGLRTDCKCKMCGNWIKTNYTNYKDFAELNICFDCNHWARIYATYEDPRRVIIKGSSYWIQSLEKPEGFAGSGGHEFKIKRNGSEEIITTRNLWSQGEIPELWREYLKDNAKFIK